MGFLLYFLFGSPWYPESRLVIQGVAEGTGAAVRARWESGEGFNTYERRHFALNTTWPRGIPEHSITIKRTGIKGGGSLDSDVRIKAIRLDDQHHVNLRRFTGGSVGMDDHGALRLKENGAEIRVSVTARHHIQIELVTNNASGAAQIRINDRVGTYDLYTHNEEIRTRKIDFWILDPGGAFQITFPVPRYPIRTMVVESAGKNRSVTINRVSLISSNEKRVLFFKKPPVGTVILRDFDKGRKRFFHPIRFGFQILFAALSTWITFGLLRQMRRYRSLRHLFVEEKRWIFWAMALGAIVVFSLWLVAFWPGVMSIDSLKIWRAAKLPGYFLNDHPILNVIFYMYLMHIYDHMAVVPVTHILLSGILGAYIFYTLFKMGVHWMLLAPFFLLFVFSVPVGLYNIVLWKDIPFAILVTFWGFMLAKMYHEKKTGTLSISLEKWVVLGLLGLSLALFRHNGIIYLFIIPVLFAALGIVSVKKLFISTLLISVLSGIVVVFGLAKLRVLDSAYLLNKGKHYLGTFKSMSFEKIVGRAASKYFYILNINQKDSKWDLWHYYLRDRYAYDNFLYPVGWNDVYPYLKPNRYPSKSLNRLAMKIYRKSYESPWVYLTWNPFYMLGIFLLNIFLFWLFPLSAVFSFFIFIQIAALLTIYVFNWRYYYFAVFSFYFLIPLMTVDLRNRFQCIKRKGAE